jgi:hypothetical protein
LIKGRLEALKAIHLVAGLIVLICQVLRLMCITIPSSANVKRSRQWVLWQWLAATPLRLFVFTGALYLTASLLQILLSSGGLTPWSAYNLLFLVLPSLMLGPLLQRLPGILRVTPISYVKYATLFFLLSASQLLFHGALVQGAAPGSIYLTLLALAWSLGLILFKGMLTASYRRDLRLGWALFLLALATGAAGVLVGIGFRFL